MCSALQLGKAVLPLCQAPRVVSAHLQKCHSLLSKNGYFLKDRWPHSKAPISFQHRVQEGSTSLVWHCAAQGSCTERAEGCEQAEGRGVTTRPPPPVPRVAKVWLCLWLRMLLNRDAAVNYRENVIHICMLLSVFFINGPRPTPDIAHCDRNLTNMDQQLTASGRAGPGPACCSILPCLGRRHFHMWSPLCPGACGTGWQQDYASTRLPTGTAGTW